MPPLQGAAGRRIARCATQCDGFDLQEVPGPPPGVMARFMKGWRHAHGPESAVDAWNLQIVQRAGDQPRRGASFACQNQVGL